MKRYSDTFFRYWLWILIPVLVLPAGEFMISRHPAPQIMATASIYASQPISTDAFQTNTPAQIETASLYEWLQSPSFDLKVVTTSPIYAKELAKVADQRVAAYNDLTRHINVTAAGDHLVTISYVTSNGQEGLQVLGGLLKTAQSSLLTVTQWQQNIAGGYYLAQLRAARLQEQHSASDLDQYMTEHGITPSEFAVQLDSDPTFSTLYNRNKSDQQSVTTLEQQVTASTGQASTPIALASKLSYLVTDQPALLITYAGTKKALTNVGIALALGLLIAVWAIVVLTATDKTMRYAGEAQTLLGLPVVAIVAHTPFVDGRDPQLATKVLPAHKVAVLEQTG